jgi:hypothetical protein
MIRVEKQARKGSKIDAKPRCSGQAAFIADSSCKTNRATRENPESLVNALLNRCHHVTTFFDSRQRCSFVFRGRISSYLDGHDCFTRNSGLFSLKNRENRDCFSETLLLLRNAITLGETRLLLRNGGSPSTEKLGLFVK